MSRKNENKKGANGAGSIRKITTTRNGKEYTYWQGRYTEGYDACTGKQIQRSITGKTQKCSSHASPASILILFCSSF